MKIKILLSDLLMKILASGAIPLWLYLCWEILRFQPLNLEPVTRNAGVSALASKYGVVLVYDCSLDQIDRLLQLYT